MRKLFNTFIISFYLFCVENSLIYQSFYDQMIFVHTKLLFAAKKS